MFYTKIKKLVDLLHCVYICIIMLEKEEFSFQGRKTKKKMERSFGEKEECWFVKKDDKEKL